MNNWQPTNTISHINSILNPKGMNLEKENDKYILYDFNGKELYKYDYLYEFIKEHIEEIYPTYDYDSEYMEEI